MSGAITHTYPQKTIPERALEQLLKFDSCTVSNAIEQFCVRTRNEGFVNSSIRCIFPQSPPKVGYAVTARIRSSSTPVTGRCYYDRADWWAHVRSRPAPRFLVAEDVDPTPGFGALFGEIHANIATALECVAYLTNGTVRDLPGVATTGLQLFAAGISVSHAYAHVVNFGDPVQVGGLQIKPGDLLHGDQHGVICIPLSIAPEIPRIATQLLQSERELIELCRSEDFSFEKLTQEMERVARKSSAPDQDRSNDSR